MTREPAWAEGLSELQIESAEAALASYKCPRDWSDLVEHCDYDETGAHVYYLCRASEHFYTSEREAGQEWPQMSDMDAEQNGVLTINPAVERELQRRNQVLQQLKEWALPSPTEAEP